MDTNNASSALGTSYIREILKTAVSAEVISFAGGLPSNQTFPKNLLKLGFEKIIDNEHLLQYGQTQGYAPLIDFLLPFYNIRPTNDVLITNGSQQGLDLIARTFINPGDCVVLETPSYLGAIQVFQLARAQLISVKQLDNGPDLDELESVFKSKEVKFFYFIADFNNPTGVTYTLDNRKQIARLCDQYGVSMIEDAPYRELRFKGAQLPLVSSFSEKRSFILRSFSKIASPGMRIGVLEANGESIDKMVKVKQVTDLHTNNLLQYVLLELLQNKNYLQHMTDLKEIYLKKYLYMYQQIQKHIGSDGQVSTVEGGMFLWLRINSDKAIDTMQLSKKLLANNVAVVPGSVFELGDNKSQNTLRLNFSYESNSNIFTGVKKIGEVIKEFKS